MDRSLAKLAPRRMLHLPSRTVRLRLTLLYSGLFLVSGVALLAATYLIFRSNSGVDLIVAPGTGAACTGFRRTRRSSAKCTKCTRRLLHVTVMVSTRVSSSPGSCSRL